MAVTRRTILQAAVAAAFAGAACAATAASAKKSIVIYFSRTGTIEGLAKTVAQLTGSDILKLELVKPYADEYSAMTYIAREERASGSDFVYIIIKGKVKVYSLTPTGVKYLERIYCEYEIFGELEAFIDKPILNYVEAIESCNAIKIPKDLFLKWIEIDREFSLYISIQISEKMYYTSINSRANVTYPLKSRLIFFLWNFLDEHNLDTVHKDILVEGVGSNIRSVNRIIKELVNEGLIEYNKGFIKVKNMDKLMDLIMSPNPNKPNFNNQN